MANKRTKKEITNIINCSHDFFGNDNSNGKIQKLYKFGFKNCCICKNCNVGCGELLNAEYLEKDNNH